MIILRHDLLAQLTRQGPGINYNKEHIILRHYRAKALRIIDREPTGRIPKDAVLNMIS